MEFLRMSMWRTAFRSTGISDWDEAVLLEALAYSRAADGNYGEGCMTLQEVTGCGGRYA